MRAHVFKAGLLVVCILHSLIVIPPARADQPLPYALEDVVALSPPAGTIRVHLAYSTSDNFLHEDVYGDLEVCYLRREVAEMLAAAQMLLEEKERGISSLSTIACDPDRYSIKCGVSLREQEKRSMWPIPRRDLSTILERL